MKLAVSGDNRSGQRLFIVSDGNPIIKKVFLTVASVPAVARTGKEKEQESLKLWLRCRRRSLCPPRHVPFKRK